MSLWLTLLYNWNNWKNFLQDYGKSIIYVKGCISYVITEVKESERGNVRGQISFIFMNADEKSSRSFSYPEHEVWTYLTLKISVCSSSNIHAWFSDGII